ncbi:hypothetical protein DXX93_18310 [Thalassotalea euphylliae]|uniref:DUF1090 family protein n=1 Tax=Thalassotalea euphylliae TaxID=1655234 RepID=A0A3E0TV35_9GAMM|nr:hypothetical protein [Thalassotalea euphylliae]REL28329.1 hypothetical protein DXX93_18310 [Thalassotalea euphylliae]
MTRNLLLLASASILLLGCAANENACEDVTLAAEQVQQCQVLQRQITQAKDRPILRTELERRYEQDCVQIRYYRDDKQAAICGNKDQLEQAAEALKKESK